MINTPKPEKPNLDLTSHSRTLVHRHALECTNTRAHTHALSLSLSHTHTHTHTLTHTLTHSHTLTHTRTHTHTRACTRAGQLPRVSVACGEPHHNVTAKPNTEPYLLIPKPILELTYHTRAFIYRHTQIPTQIHTQTHTNTRAHTRSLSLSLTHTHTHTHTNARAPQLDSSSEYLVRLAMPSLDYTQVMLKYTWLNLYIYIYIYIYIHKINIFNTHMRLPKST